MGEVSEGFGHNCAETKTGEENRKTSIKAFIRTTKISGAIRKAIRRLALKILRAPLVF